MTIINRFFADLKKAKAAMKAMAVENKCTMFLYVIFYGQNFTPEYSVRYPHEIMDPESPHVIDRFTPNIQPANEQ